MMSNNPGRTWTPESLGMRSRQNFQLWKDIEQAYQYVETYARFSISGDIHAFLFELVRRRWSLACSNVYEPPPEYSASADARETHDLLPAAPAGLSEASVGKLPLTKTFVDEFLGFVATWSQERRDQETMTSNKLYGYGTDGYGTYIPLHLLWPNLKNYWGIYISQEGVLSLAALLQSHLNIGQMKLFPEEEAKMVDKVIQIAYQVILRHQLFHFKIEQWALLFELATGRPYYLPYLQYVYLPTIHDTEDNNLEEALANLSILLSIKIQKTAREADVYVNNILEREFLQKQGPNYRNYNLNEGVPFSHPYYIQYREVVNYLCNQIIRHELRPQAPLAPYYLYPPNNNFLRAENLCPIYLVRNLPYQAGVIA